MGSSKLLIVVACGGLALAGCAQQQQPEQTMVRPQPVFDKMGNVGCTASDGRIVFVPGAANRPDYLAPCDELCDNGPLTDANGSVVDPCLPPGQETHLGEGGRKGRG